MKLFARYLLKEVGAPLAAWVAFLFLFLLVMQFLRATDVILGSAVTSTDLVLLIFFMAPHFLVLAMPVAFLLSILLGMGRMNEDRELLALQAVGVGPGQILWVPTAMGLALGGCVLWLSSTAEPWGLTQVKGLMNEIVKKNISGDVKSGEFYEDLTNLTLYAEEVDRADRRWTNVLVHDDRDPAAPTLVVAREGRVNPAGSGEALKLVLSDGDLHIAKRSNMEYNIVSFDRGEIVVGVEDNLFAKNRFRSPKDELTPAELIRAAHAAKAEGSDPLPFLMAYHRRYGQALTPVSFALIGVPMALSRRRSGRSASYLLTIVGYIAYYVLFRFFENLGSQGRLPFVWAAQLHNVLFAAVGLLLLFRVTRAGAAG